MLRAACNSCLRLQSSALSRSFAARATVPTVNPSFSLPPQQTLSQAFGGDVTSLVYRSISDMVPVREVQLSGRLFNAPVRADLVHRVVHWQLAKRRAGTASTKTRGEVAASGIKIRPQKGTGRSRQGARSSPLFRGGGRAHGPKPRDWSYPLPIGVRRNALRSILSERYGRGALWVVEGVEGEGKTKALIDVVERAGWHNLLVVDGDGEGVGVDNTFERAARNINGVMGLDVMGVNVYDVLRFHTIVLSMRALEALEERFAQYDCLV